MTADAPVIFITGASRGIGRAIALRLARDRPGHIVVGYASDHRAARETTERIEELGVAASVAGLDVGREELLRRTFDSIRDAHGRLDVFVSNAARTTFRPVMDLNSRNWQKVMDINARAFLLGSQLAAELMQATGGRIVGISSLGSRHYVQRYAALGVAKAAMEALTRYLAVELAQWDINVNVVCAGFIDTASMRLAPDYKELTADLVARTPAGRLGRAEDVAGVVAFLCSPDSNWIRGQTLVADGGYSLGLGQFAER